LYIPYFGIWGQGAIKDRKGTGTFRA
jgi:hypothetical protein